MTQQRWLRIISVALIMYTISYVDRTNVSLALDPKISNLMRDLFMDDKMKGEAAGIFFFGYVLLQIPGGILASRWSARKFISLCLIAWGLCAIGCGLSQSFRQFEFMRFSGRRRERGFPQHAGAAGELVYTFRTRPRQLFWLLCQPLAVAGSAPLTGWLLGAYGWQQMLILEGILPFIWLPVWWFCIRDHPCEAKWIAPEERDFLEAALQKEASELEPVQKISWVERLSHPSILVMVALYFLHNCAAYGCMTFFTDGLKGKGFSALQYGFLFAVPYAVTAVVMILNSWHSDKIRERRGHVAAMYFMSGTSLILSVAARDHFLGFLCIYVPGHSRPIRSDGSLLGHPQRNVTTQRDGRRHGTR